VADNFVQHLTRGGELLRSDRVEEARAELEAARGLRPGDAKALSLLGLVYFRLGRFDEAREIYKDLVIKQPTDASLQLNLGLVYLKLGDVEQAISALVKARDLDPGQTRTVGYLGLAYARSGQYAKAREAFLAAGQEELAREMEQYLSPEEKAAHKPPPPPVEAMEAPATMPSAAAAAAAAGLQPPSPSTPVVMPRAPNPAATPPPPPPRSERSSTPPPAVAAVSAGGAAAAAGENGAAPAERMDGEGVVSAAVRIAELPTPARADYGDASSGAPTAVGAFAQARLIRPDDGEMPFELGAGDTLIVRVRGRVLSRTEGVIVSGGELSYEPATKRVRGRMTEEPFGSDARPMFFVSGHGHLVATSRGRKFTALELTDDVLYAREDLVFAFEERLRWENGHVPGSSGAVPVVQFRGEGCVALRTRRPPLTVKLLPEKVLYVDADLLAGWIGRVVPRVVTPAAGGEASAPFVECSGEGILIVLEPEEPEDLRKEA
jgi:tetratricopeptide (TPR) repeat protein/uncharacterized protein (AIM24 family)